MTRFTVRERPATVVDPWSMIIPNLWVGTSEWLAERARFDAVLTLDGTRDVGSGVKHMQYDMPTHMPPDPARLQAACDWAQRRYTTGNRVLIRCNNGLDRSGLVAAKILVALGSTPQEAMDVVRMRRAPHAISPRFLRAIS
jgi:protein-tyrosine phosphatase